MDDGSDHGRLDETVREQLGDSPDCACETIHALGFELTKTSGGSINIFWERANVVYTPTCISCLVVKLRRCRPTAGRQKQCLEDQTSVFQESRESIHSLRDT